MLPTITGSGAPASPSTSKTTRNDTRFQRIAAEAIAGRPPTLPGPTSQSHPPASRSGARVVGNTSARSGANVTASLTRHLKILDDRLGKAWLRFSDSYADATRETSPVQDKCMAFDACARTLSTDMKRCTSYLNATSLLYLPPGGGSSSEQAEDTKRLNVRLNEIEQIQILAVALPAVGKLEATQRGMADLSVRIEDLQSPQVITAHHSQLKYACDALLHAFNGNPSEARTLLRKGKIPFKDGEPIPAALGFLEERLTYLVQDKHLMETIDCLQEIYAQQINYLEAAITHLARLPKDTIIPYHDKFGGPASLVQSTADETLKKCRFRLAEIKYDKLNLCHSNSCSRLSVASDISNYFYKLVPADDKEEIRTYLFNVLDLLSENVHIFLNNSEDILVTIERALKCANVKEDIEALIRMATNIHPALIFNLIHLAHCSITKMRCSPALVNSAFWQQRRFTKLLDAVDTASLIAMETSKIKYDPNNIPIKMNAAESYGISGWLRDQYTKAAALFLSFAARSQQDSAPKDICEEYANMMKDAASASEHISAALQAQLEIAEENPDFHKVTNAGIDIIIKRILNAQKTPDELEKEIIGDSRQPTSKRGERVQKQSAGDRNWQRKQTQQTASEAPQTIDTTEQEVSTAKHLLLKAIENIHLSLEDAENDESILSEETRTLGRLNKDLNDRNNCMTPHEPTDCERQRAETAKSIENRQGWVSADYGVALNESTAIITRLKELDNLRKRSPILAAEWSDFITEANRLYDLASGCKNMEASLAETSQESLINKIDSQRLDWSTKAISFLKESRENEIRRIALQFLRRPQYGDFHRLKEKGKITKVIRTFHNRELTHVNRDGSKHVDYLTEYVIEFKIPGTNTLDRVVVHEHRLSPAGPAQRRHFKTYEDREKTGPGVHYGRIRDLNTSWQHFLTASFRETRM